MRNYVAKNVDEYIESAPREAQPKLKEMRAVIKSSIPEAEESISWGIPFYKHHGPLAGFSVFKKHVGFGFAAQLDNQLRSRLEKKGYTTGSKTVQILFDQALPIDEIKEIIITQAKLNKDK